MRWAGLIIGFGGVAVLAGPDAAHGDALSVAAVLLTALGYAIGPIIANRKLADAPARGGQRRLPGPGGAGLRAGRRPDLARRNAVG